MQYITTLILILTLTVSCSSRHDKKIAIQPFGEFDKSLCDSVLVSIERTYSFSVEVLPSIKFPQNAFIDIKSPRYRADTLIRHLMSIKSNKYDHVLGLTLKDISTTKRDLNDLILEPKYKYEDWGVFGLGFSPGVSCIVSTFRLKTNNRSLLIERLKKVCNHELGHNLGLPHCTSNDKCVMKDGAESIRTVDHVDLVLCTACEAQID